LFNFGNNFRLGQVAKKQHERPNLRCTNQSHWTCNHTKHNKFRWKRKKERKTNRKPLPIWSCDSSM